MEREQPLVCPWCKQTEPNEFLLQNNHWVKTEEMKALGGYDWCEANGMCIAQQLTRNHVMYDVDRLVRVGTDRWGREVEPLTPKERNMAVDRLAVDIERATLLWSHRDDTDWLDEALDVLDGALAQRTFAMAIESRLIDLEAS